MTDASRSPKRVRILSSINPLGGDGGKRGEESGDSGLDGHIGHNESMKDDLREDSHDSARDASKTSKFRFKSKHSKSRHRSSRQHHNDDQDEEDQDQKNRTPSSRHHRHHHHHRTKRRRSCSPSNEAEPEDPFRQPGLDPDAAFRESLFDAMADDEGAAYWQGVYGQPIHVYGAQREQVNDQGELERMTDDEYAAFVRQKMWEKTHAGLLEERERRAKAREEKERREEEEARIAAEMERSLRRGEERRRRKVWKERWSGYVEAWAGWDGSLETVAWPVESGRREDIGEEEVRSFFVKGLDLEALGEKEFAVRLKEERVRWHPDKMQQRLGGQVDEAVMRDVTAIFQIIDKLWSATRGK